MLKKTDKIIYRKIKLLKLLDVSRGYITIEDDLIQWRLSTKTTQAELDDLKGNLEV